jgi:hypothetical protein
MRACTQYMYYFVQNKKDIHMLNCFGAHMEQQQHWTCECAFTCVVLHTHAHTRTRTHTHTYIYRNVEHTVLCRTTCRNAISTVQLCELKILIHAQTTSFLYCAPTICGMKFHTIQFAIRNFLFRDISILTMPPTLPLHFFHFDSPRR